MTTLSIFVVATLIGMANASCTGGYTQTCQDRYWETYSTDHTRDLVWGNCRSSYCNTQDSGCSCRNVGTGPETGSIRCMGINVWCGDLTTESSCKRNRCDWEGEPTPPTPQPTIAPTTTCHRPFRMHELSAEEAIYHLLDFRTGYPSDDYAFVWYEKNHDEGTYKERLIATDTKSLQDYHAVDLDSDGNMDVVFLQSAAGWTTSGWTTTRKFSGDGVGWFQNMGDGTFGKHVLSPYTPKYAKIIQVSDIDGDGHLDILTAFGYSDSDTGSQYIWWFRNNGDGTFAPQAEIRVVAQDEDTPITRGRVYTFRMADVNNDGKIDILCSRPLVTLWYINQGDGTFQENIVNADNYLQDAIEVDLNQDGLLDVVARQNGAPKLFWYANLGNGVWEQHRFPTDDDDGELFVDDYEHDTSGYGFGDLNRDGLVDVIVSGHQKGVSGEGFIWFENLGTDNFQGHFIRTQSTKKGAFLHDTNKDGFLDILSGDVCMETIPECLGGVAESGGTPASGGVPSSTGGSGSPETGGVPSSTNGGGGGGGGGNPRDPESSSRLTLDGSSLYVGITMLIMLVLLFAGAPAM